MQIQYAGDRGDPYRAGGCNIGPAEIARRRRSAVVAAIATLVIALALVLADAPAPLRLVLFPPLAATLVSVEQVRRRFCVAFGLAGIRNFGSLGSTEEIADVADRGADRRAALVVIGYSVLIALAVTLVFVALAL